MAEDKSHNVASTTKEDVEKNKTIAIVSWFIFFIPLLTDAKDSKFAKFHANQSLLVFLVYVVAVMLSGFLIGFLLYPVAFVLWIIGIIGAANGQMKRLPVIGNIDLIK